MVVLSDRLAFDESLVVSVQATFERRGTRVDLRVLDDLRAELRGRRWEAEWSAMTRDKLVRNAPPLPDAVRRFEVFVGPVLVTLAAPPGLTPGIWRPGGPWSGWAWEVPIPDVDRSR